MSGESPTFFHHAVVKARKPHKCYECRGAIQPEEKYHKFAGVWNGDFQTFQRCGDCHTLAVEIENQRDSEFGAHEDNNVEFGGLLEHASESEDNKVRLSKVVAIMQKCGAIVPQWAIDRLKGDEQ